MDGKKYDTTLVDLPTIIESQKTLDNKQFYKIADICQVSKDTDLFTLWLMLSFVQMLVVDDGSSKDESQVPPPRSTDPYTFDHGITPPLKHVRRRRFRQKLSKRVSYQASSVDQYIILKGIIMIRPLKKWKEKWNGYQKQMLQQKMYNMVRNFVIKYG